MPNTTCLIEDCEAQPAARGWCTMHYQRWQKHGDPMGGKHRRRRSEPRALCSIEGCDKPVKGRGWCGTHYKRVLLTGDPGTAELRCKPFVEGMTEKQCTGCRETKLLTEFHKVNRKSKYVAQCKSCRNAQISIMQRKRLYGLDDEAYLAMIETQGGVCAICGSSNRLCVDHDHATGAVRQLLCDMCNKALGLVEDSPDRLRALAAYLEAHNEGVAA